MEVTKKLTPYNFTSKNDKNRIKYIVVHYFGGLSTAENLLEYWHRQYVGASAHYIVGHDGKIYQSVEDGDIAWHCGAQKYVHPDCRNSNSIGIEMAVRKRDTSTLLASDPDWYFEPATEQAAQELVREKMQEYGIPAENVLRHYDVTGKICPNPYVLEADAWTAFLAGLAEPEKEELTKITGKSVATAEQMAAYLVSRNPAAAPYALEHAQIYLEEGAAENIRADGAWAQRCLETGNDTFAGSAVTFDQYNFCGHGVTKNGMRGTIFPDLRTGIRAQIQHLKAYASTQKLKQECVDDRFRYVKRGSSPYFEWLGIQENPKKGGWAAGVGYGGKIITILDNILRMGTGESMDPEAENKPEPEMKPEGIFLYQIRTTVDSLRIRKGPGVTYPETGAINEVAGKKNLYTIVEEQNGWGRLKSGAGWISLTYTQKEGESYLVRTTVDSLRIRRGPGISYPETGVINEKTGSKKKYTIIEEQNGWGRLKSGAGWISLAYTMRA